MQKKKLLILVNDLNFFVSHRISIAESALAKGYDVTIGYGEKSNTETKLLEKKGFRVNYIPMSRGSINPIRDLRTFFYIWKFFKKESPDISHLITIKPYLYGGIISRLTGVPCVVSAVSGLGTLFIRKNLIYKFLLLFLKPIYKFTFSHPNQKVILQNEDDLKTLVSWGVLKSFKVKLIKGSGVELEKFTVLEEPVGVPVVCFASRLLRDKGIYEFVYAACLLKKMGINARFIVAGNVDVGNPSGLNNNDLEYLKKENCVEFLGYQNDIPALYSNSNIICLPSYREGFPKSLIEAAAAARSVVTTNVPGCRHAIIPNKTGLLVPAKDYKKLAYAIKWLIDHPKERVLMGLQGRKLAEKEFQLKKITQYHLDIYEDLLKNK